MKQKQQGFSLLEIMVVVAIIGLLASLILPNVIGAGEQADRQKAITDIGQLENALDQYRLDNSRYPTTEQGLEALVREPTVDPLPRNYRRGGYIKRLPTDPWGAEYLLLSPGEHGDVDIFSVGPDAQAGTEDDIANWNLDGRDEN
ncbi:general secretion pathway protein GspG [Pseudidiomarina salinarum]|uniref:Type II secretion system core protein G n=1 Tax=Pseudidiomarina salinarum TaxID=435908 RepID=A0A094L977_9GAMM|nr:type II secretion system major pseudopilin GspG [Pseudidiomarina salinarum]KFZ31338.1 general secretion pathway protein GspG [Pseudidiomarina salinarum]RUO70910.1 type II secretion system protein GspG [Pseudidiomarina salinarum]